MYKPFRPTTFSPGVGEEGSSGFREFGANVVAGVSSNSFVIEPDKFQEQGTGERKRGGKKANK